MTEGHGAIGTGVASKAAAWREAGGGGGGDGGRS